MLTTIGSRSLSASRTGHSAEATMSLFRVQSGSLREILPRWRASGAKRQSNHVLSLFVRRDPICKQAETKWCGGLEVGRDGQAEGSMRPQLANGRGLTFRLTARKSLHGSCRPALAGWTSEP